MAIEEEEEVVGAITLALSCIPNMELKKTSLARLTSSSYMSIKKLVCEHLYLRCIVFLFI
jgi:transportin-3